MYDQGQGQDEPDYRFSLANERTFLAWIRTSLALMAAGIAVRALAATMSPVTDRVLAGTLVLLGTACAAVGWIRWGRSERAIRAGAPLPRFSGAIVVSCVVSCVGLALVLLL